jgi:hypothetical protein
MQSNIGDLHHENRQEPANVYFVQCAAGPCCSAWDKTLQVLRAHYPAAAQSLFLIANARDDAAQNEPRAADDNVIWGVGKSLEQLATQADATQVADLTTLADLLKAGDLRPRRISISPRTLAEQAIAAADRFRQKLGNEYDAPLAPTAGSCLVTSLYDEQNLLRLNEYLSCLVLNLQVFERIAISYEASDGLLGIVVHAIAERLSIPPGRILLMPQSGRPTFEELFALQSLVPHGSTLAVANADVIFDASFGRLAEIDHSGNVVVLSRRDIVEGTPRTRLVHLRTNSAPNIFSADAWIVSTPFAPDFPLQYEIGTMHCDSYINNRISTSKRYSALNPCFDVHVFHHHDERFNSTLAKRDRDGEAIRARYEQERARLGGLEPLTGVAWCAVGESAAAVPRILRFQTLKPRAVIFEFGADSEGHLGCVLVAHFLYSRLPALLADTVTVGRLRRADLRSTGQLLARYQALFGRSDFLQDLDDEDSTFGQAAKNVNGTGIVQISQLAELIIAEAPEREWHALLWPAENGEPLHAGCRVIGGLPAKLRTQLLDTMRRLDEHAAATLEGLFGQPAGGHQSTN